MASVLRVPAKIFQQDNPTLFSGGRRQNSSADTLPLSLESIAEISKEGKVAERSEDLIVEAHSDKEDARPKRVTKKPTYLKDYV